MPAAGAPARPPTTRHAPARLQARRAAGALPPPPTARRPLRSSPISGSAGALPRCARRDLGRPTARPPCRRRTRPVRQRRRRRSAARGGLCIQTAPGALPPACDARFRRARPPCGRAPQQDLPGSTAAPRTISGARRLSIQTAGVPAGVRGATSAGSTTRRPCPSRTRPVRQRRRRRSAACGGLCVQIAAGAREVLRRYGEHG